MDKYLFNTYDSVYSYFINGFLSFDRLLIREDYLVSIHNFYGFKSIGDVVPIDRALPIY